MADTKVVYNACYGGFGLSDKATKRYAELKGITLYPEATDWITYYWLVPPGPARDKRGSLFMDSDIERTDPILIQVVEELGAEANGKCADLRIESIPKGTRYRIEEYDGREWIETEEDTRWSVA